MCFTTLRLWKCELSVQSHYLGSGSSPGKQQVRETSGLIGEELGETLPASPGCPAGRRRAGGTSTPTHGTVQKLQPRNEAAQINSQLRGWSCTRAESCSQEQGFLLVQARHEGCEPSAQIRHRQLRFRDPKAFSLMVFKNLNPPNGKARYVKGKTKRKSCPGRRASSDLPTRRWKEELGRGVTPSPNTLQSPPCPSNEFRRQKQAAAGLKLPLRHHAWGYHKA